MTIQFKNSHGGLSPALQERIEQKLGKLARFTDSDLHAAHATFEMDRAVGSHQNGDIWQATITVDANGTRFYTQELAETPIKSSEKALKEIRRELKRARKKHLALTRRQGSFWKMIAGS